MGRPNDDAGKGERGGDEPAEVGSYEDQEPERALTFMQHDFGLDRRLMKAVAKIGFVYPTLVQSKCIPLALKGKDLLVRFFFPFFFRNVFVPVDSCMSTPGSTCPLEGTASISLLTWLVLLTPHVYIFVVFLEGDRSGV